MAWSWPALRPCERSAIPASGVESPTSDTSRACSRAFESARPVTFAFSVCIRKSPIRTIGTRHTTPNSTSHRRFWKKLMFTGFRLDRQRGRAPLPAGLLRVGDCVARGGRRHGGVLDLTESLHERVPLA